MFVTFSWMLLPKSTKDSFCHMLVCVWRGADGVGRGLDSRRIHLSRSGCFVGIRKGSSWGGCEGERRDVEEFEVSKFQLIDALLQLKILLRQFRLFHGRISTRYLKAMRSDTLSSTFPNRSFNS